MFNITSSTFSTIFFGPLFTSLQPVLGELLSTNDALLLLFCLSRGFSFQAQFLPTSFYFMAMCCMLDSFVVLFDRADSFLLQLILEKKFVFHV